MRPRTPFCEEAFLYLRDFFLLRQIFFLFKARPSMPPGPPPANAKRDDRVSLETLDVLPKNSFEAFSW